MCVSLWLGWRLVRVCLHDRDGWWAVGSACVSLWSGWMVGGE